MTASGKLRWAFDGKGQTADWPSYDPVHRRVGLLLAAAAETWAFRWQRTFASERNPVALDPKNPKTPAGYFTANKVLNSIPNSDGTVAVIPGATITLADGTGPAELGGIDLGKRAKVTIGRPDITHGLMVTDWKNSPPYLRSKDGDYSGPGSPEQKQNILNAGGIPAQVRGSWARRAAWDAKRFVHVNSNSPDLLVFDRGTPITISWGGRGRDVEPLAEEIQRTGKVLARAILNTGKAFRGATDRDRVAMILAGEHAVIATVNTGPGTDVHLRPAATVQVIDLTTGAITVTFEVKPGVIETGMATSQGRVFLSLDDGSLVAME
ncbi:MAG: hypothetical protein ACAI43_02015 [Phycisphaerae bacterium]